MTRRRSPVASISAQREAVLAKNATFLAQWEDRAIERLADGGRSIRKIEPYVVPVQTEAEAALFRFATLHWSVPVSQGYGRRTRFLIFDRWNEKLIGVFALGDPVFNLGVRDRLIGWGQAERQQRLYNVYDAYVLGAVDPYRQLIAGKLAAFCAVADETAAHLEQKYAGTTTVIRGEEKNASPVLITTTSSLGRSSIYNRLRYDGRHVFKSIGFTQGYGHFHFSDELFTAIIQFVAQDGKRRFAATSSARGRTGELGHSGAVWRNSVSTVNCSATASSEKFYRPRAAGWRAYLGASRSTSSGSVTDFEDLSAHWRDRWAIPRARRDPSYAKHLRESMRLTAGQ